MPKGADLNGWTPQGACHRLKMAALRLCPSIVLGEEPGGIKEEDRQVTLPQVVALCEAEDLDPFGGAGRFLLVIGIEQEIRKCLRLRAMFAEQSEQDEIARDPKAWLEKHVVPTEDEIAARWGEPVVRLVRQRREQPEFFEQVLATFEPDQEPCLNASM